MGKRYCIDCGKQLANYKALRCQKHANWIVTRSFVGKKLSNEHKEKLKASWDYSKHITPSWCKKQSLIRKGIPVTPIGSKWSEKQRIAIMNEKKNRDPEKELERRRKLRESHLREKSYQWKGGKITQNGYISILLDEKWVTTGKKKYKREHRIIMEKHLGRFLNKNEHVHHIDGDKTNNKIKNLMLFANAKAHAEYHVRISGKAHT